MKPGMRIPCVMYVYYILVGRQVDRQIDAQILDRYVYLNDQTPSSTKTNIKKYMYLFPNYCVGKIYQVFNYIFKELALPNFIII